MNSEPVRLKLVRVKITGKRFWYLSEARGIVHCKGEVRRVSGFSAIHGPDRKFKRDYVEIADEVLTEELLSSLLAEAVDPLPEPRKPWAVRELDYACHETLNITPYGAQQLEPAGRDMAADIPGLEEYAQDAAVDAAAYHHELTMDGVPEGYMSILRECAADYIYDGICKGLKEKGIEI